MAPVAEKNKVVVLATNAASTDITNAGDYIFRLFPSDVVRGKLYAGLAIADGFEEIAVLVENALFPQSLLKVFKEEYGKLGGRIVAEETYEPKATDLRMQLTKIKAVHPRALFVVSIDQQSGTIAIRQARVLGINAEKIYSTYIILNPTVIWELSEAANGVVALDISNTIKNEGLREEYTAFHGQEPSYNFFLAAYVDAIQITKNALENCVSNSSIDTDCVKRFFYDMDWFEGQFGKIKFDQNGDVIGVTYSEWEVIEGKAEEIKQLY